MGGRTRNEEARATRFTVGDVDIAVLSVPAHVVSDDVNLTAAERDVARLLARGLSNARIARLRRTSTRTVANQVASLLRKVGAESRADLVRHLIVAAK